MLWKISWDCLFAIFGFQLRFFLVSSWSLYLRSICSVYVVVCHKQKDKNKSIDQVQKQANVECHWCLCCHTIYRTRTNTHTHSHYQQRTVQWKKFYVCVFVYVYSPSIKIIVYRSLLSQINSTWPRILHNFCSFFFSFCRRRHLVAQAECSLLNRKS